MLLLKNKYKVAYLVNSNMQGRGCGKNGKAAALDKSTIVGILRLKFPFTALNRSSVEAYDKLSKGKYHWTAMH